MERGAGTAAGFPDESYALAGAELVTDAAAALAGADVVLRVAPPAGDEIAALPPGALLISHLRPLEQPELIQALAGRGVSALAVELVPRITRAQTMDALSSQASIAGYRAVLVAADAAAALLPPADDRRRARCRRPRCWCWGRAWQDCRRSRRRAGWEPW